MQEFTIHKETPPTRCEICHKSDLFDTTTGKCSRCENVAIVQQLASTADEQRILSQNNYTDLAAIGAAALSVLAFIPGILFPLANLVLGVLGLIASLNTLSRIRSRRQRRSGEIFSYVGIYCGSLASILGLLRFVFALYKP